MNRRNAPSTSSNNSFHMTEQAVIDYLVENPFFWAKHPQIMIKHNLSYPQFQNISSFYEYKSKTVEENYDSLVKEFQTAVEFAHHNQQIFLEFQNILFNILPHPKRQWSHLLGEELVNKSYADFIYELELTSRGMQALLRHFQSETYCGPFTLALSKILHMVDPLVQSCALLPFKKTRLFVLGHTDPHHFDHDMDTLFLDQLRVFLDVAHKK